MDKNSQHIRVLYRRFLGNQCSPEELEELLAYFDRATKDGEEQQLLPLIEEHFLRPGKKEESSIAETIKLIQLQGNIKKRISGKKKAHPPVTYLKHIKGIAAATILLVLIGGGGYIWHRSPHNHHDKTVRENLPKEIAAGHAGATLHLGDGRTIILDSTANGLLAVQGNIQVIKDKNGIRYIGKNQVPVYNTIETGPGRQYHFILPDGSAVWLNASSSIVYPTAFKGANRTVRITGEAYFQVLHNAQKPFMVQVGKQVIEDIGTAFNVNAYPDEAYVQTTIVEGAARVTAGRRSAILKPGQQARVNDNFEIVPHADMETVLGWKNGSFQFHNTSLKEVMRQVGRWYNATIEYNGDVEPERFTGSIPRNISASKVLTILEELGVKFSIKQVPENGEKGIITVTP